MNGTENSTMMDRINIEATEWALQRESGALRGQDAEAFEAWCAKDSRHLNAYRSAADTLQGLSAMGKMPDFAHLLPPLTWRERISMAAAKLQGAAWSMPVRTAFAGMAVIVAVFAGIYLRPSAYETSVGQIRAVTLDDGTVVTLGGDSRIEVAFTRNERQVSLTHGEAFFAVTKNPARPFFVAAGETVVRVVGTKFDVHRGAEEVRVAVVEGVVEVSHPEGLTPSTANSKIETILAGEQIVAPRRGALEKLKVASLAQPAAWQSGRLDYNGASLREVVADANRYYAPGVVLESDELGDLKVTTSFRASQVDQMVDTLSMALPVNVERKTGGKLVLHKKN